MALTFDDDQAAALLDALGLPVDTTDLELILAAVADLVEQSTGGEQKPSNVIAAAKRQGLDVVDADALAALRAEAAEGRQIKAAAARQKIEDAVDAAINKGKITVARRKHWLNLIEADPGMAEVLASVPDETAVPLTEIGHGQADEATNGPTDAWFH
ncbi:phage protease [Mycobacterium marinum]|uniref:phage protease n=1 Tax=Mycobacterium marinum TaxID=1781 RepID=UPI002358932F|nr:phage protease [Mycobacterium marinum]MDC8980503.1 phage protease [Mycobacterium marinum]MDC8998063.1 phage protease [Mycobacterium marinum]MDC9008803.1 phage protease [Mycobacterium marinum]